MSSDAEFSPVVFATIAGAGATSSAQTEHFERAAEQAQVRGHAAGYAKGLRAATAIAEERLQLLEAAHEQRAAQREARLDQAHDALVVAIAAVQRTTLPVITDSDGALLSAAIELAEAVIGRELADAQDGAAAALRRVLAELSSETELAGITVRMHPADAELLANDSRLSPKLTIVADTTLQAGDALAEFADGVIDARIGTALQRAKHALSGEQQ